jgi:uncharacterized Zn-binding protein involved in type VI secretion
MITMTQSFQDARVFVQQREAMHAAQQTSATLEQQATSRSTATNGMPASKIAQGVGGALSSVGTFAATGSGLGLANGLMGAATVFLPPEFAQYAGLGKMVVSKGLESLLSGGAPNLGNLLSLDGLLGAASQFLPPWAGDALAAGKALLSGDPIALLNGLASRFLPPELQGLWSTFQKMGGIKGLLSEAFPAPGVPAPDEPPPTSGVEPWAARVSDVVICPANVPGMILPPAYEKVLIGGMPAARQTDKALCIGAPDEIQTGEKSVLIGNLPAARLGDPTVHCGIIKSGWPSVWIGKSLADTSRCIQLAAATHAALVVGPAME